MLANVNVSQIATVSEIAMRYRRMASDFFHGFCKLKDHNILEGK